MTRMQTLKTLLEREEKLRDDALAALRQAEGQAQNARNQADALVQYRTEYHQRWSTQFQQGGAIEIVRCYHGFVERLDGALGQARNTVRQFEGHVTRARERVQEREVRVATVKRLIERHLKQLAAVQARRDQKNMDELAQRRRPGAAAFGYA